jgi:hypothetical protein
VKRLEMLVTPDGRWVFPDSEEFLSLLGDAAPDYDAISFAVKNLGFIKFQFVEQSIIEVELHPRVGLQASGSSNCCGGSEAVPHPIFRYGMALRDLILGGTARRTPLRIVHAGLHPGDA